MGQQQNSSTLGAQSQATWSVRSPSLGCFKSVVASHAVSEKQDPVSMLAGPVGFEPTTFASPDSLQLSSAEDRRYDPLRSAALSVFRSEGSALRAHRTALLQFNISICTLSLIASLNQDDWFH